MRRGKFIVLEGIDGSGTTSQGARLVEIIREHRQKVLFTHQPSSGPAGSLIRLALAGRLVGPSGGYHDETNNDTISTSLDSQTFALLFAADRMDHIATQIRPALESGRHVICDRYVLSTLAYQGLSLDPEWLFTLNKHALLPDLTIFLDVPVEQAKLRMRHARWERDLFEEEDQLREVRLRYHQMMSRFEDRLGKVVRLDSSQSLSRVEKEIWLHVKPLVTGLAMPEVDELTLFD